MPEFKHDLSVVLCGEAGQGIQTVEGLFTRLCKLANFNVFATKEYMSRVRGGLNSTSLRIASSPVNAYEKRIDLLLPLSPGSLRHLNKRLSATTIVIGEKENIESSELPKGAVAIDAPLSQIAKEAGSPLFSNTVAVGILSGLLGMDFALLEGLLKKQFAKKEEKVITGNLTAAKRGYELGEGWIKAGTIKMVLKPDATVKDQIVVSGVDAMALGALAGGCNFLAAYPMTPATGILTFLSQQAHELGIVVEQAEDEISAINMALGAGYAGARAMVSTAGGGFALMNEGVGLAGMIEQPIVIAVGQRPAPATGLPTRTEQGDLNLVVYSGHGEFPRLVLAPGSIEEAFSLTQRAFNLADKFQIPVFVLFDQYLGDSYYNLAAFDLKNIPFQSSVIETQEGYRRYVLTKDGVSPRGVPGLGSGMVLADSDEHDESGHITEDLDLRVKMVDKRLKKGAGLEKDSIGPELIGDPNSSALIVEWGSNKLLVAEALQRLSASGKLKEKVAQLHFSQVFPVPPQAESLIQKAKKIILVENNATGQFNNLIKLAFGREADQLILQYNGLPFDVETLSEKIKEALK